MKHPRSDAHIRDAVNNCVNIFVTIELSIDDGEKLVIVKFYVVDKLGADVIFGGDFFGKYVETIRLHRRGTKLDGGTKVLIITESVTGAELRFRFRKPKSMKNKQEG